MSGDRRVIPVCKFCWIINSTKNDTLRVQFYVMIQLPCHDLSHCCQVSKGPLYTSYYHMSNSRWCMGVNGEALQLHVVLSKAVFLHHITWESVSGTASHACCIWTWNEIEGSYDKIIITTVPSWKQYHSFIAIGIFTHAAHSQQYIAFYYVCIMVIMDALVQNEFTAGQNLL